MWRGSEERRSRPNPSSQPEGDRTQLGVDRPSGRARLLGASLRFDTYTKGKYRAGELRDIPNRRQCYVWRSGPTARCHLGLNGA
jgi:hypothetical protein